MITDTHRAFARAVVALARQHGMEYVNLRFRLGFSHLERTIEAPLISASWTAGRHGDSANIVMQTEAHDVIKERPDHEATGSAKP